MTGKELKQLAKSYAESVCHADKYDFALPVLQWLAENYVITEKQ